MDNVECLFCNFPWDIFFLSLLLGGILWWLIDRITGARLRSRLNEKTRKLSMIESENSRIKKEYKDNVSSIQADGDRLKREQNEKLSALQLDFDKLNKEHKEKLSFWEAESRKLNSELEEIKKEATERIEKLRSDYENMLAATHSEEEKQTDAGETKIIDSLKTELEGLKKEYLERQSFWESEKEKLGVELEDTKKAAKEKIERLRTGYENMLAATHTEEDSVQKDSETIDQLKSELETIKQNYEAQIAQLQKTVRIVRMDDLKIVEGIGPGIEKLFNEAGIYSFDDLANSPADKLQNILDSAGSAYTVHNPGTWAEQAAMARDGKWEQLWKWQDELKGGIKVEGAVYESEADKIKRQMAEVREELKQLRQESEEWKKAAVQPPRRMDDLKLVEGIGPGIERLFNEADIYSFDDLANTPVERLQEILDAGGPAYTVHNPGTWAEQAAMARDGKWDQLWKWQDELKGGREE